MNTQTVLQDLNNKDDTGADLDALDVEEWVANSGFTLAFARDLIASAAKEYAWFKNPYQGRRLAEWIVENRDALTGSTLIATIDQLHDDIYGPKPDATTPEDDW